MSFIYISHDLEEILQVSDQVTILNNGMRIGTEKTSTLDKYKLFELSYSYSVEQENRDDLKQITLSQAYLGIYNLSVVRRNVGFGGRKQGFFTLIPL